MRRLYLAFLRGTSASRLSRVGVVLVTSSLLTFIVLEAMRLVGMITNAYFGLITYMLFPALFLLGLVLIPVGWIRLARKTGVDLRTLLEKRFDDEHLREHEFGSGLFRMFAAVKTVREINRRNIHYHMNVGWGDYPTHLGHADGGGCFRCHNPYLVDDEGRTISMECTLCHSILALGESEPFKYLFPVDEESTDREMEMHRYLRDEFLRATGK